MDVAVEDGEACFDLRDFGGGEFGHFGIGAGGQRTGFLQLRAEGACFQVGSGEFLEPCLLAHDVPRFGRITVKVVEGNKPVQLGQALTFFGDERREIHKTKNGDRPLGGAITV